MGTKFAKPARKTKIPERTKAGWETELEREVRLLQSRPSLTQVSSYPVV